MEDLVQSLRAAFERRIERVYKQFDQLDKALGALEVWARSWPRQLPRLTPSPPVPGRPPGRPKGSRDRYRRLRRDNGARRSNGLLVDDDGGECELDPERDLGFGADFR